ncbi:flagellar FliJ family protein [Nocardioides sp. Bht2]|uniref:flagellar FliJ family protein n=1 Tax=Nocardioides sp. Bht2 TaxID=3392297 RepID=UPI0039B55C62
MSRKAMQAVARVREVRERDSRLGMGTALAEHRACQDAAAQAQEVLANSAAPEVTSALDFVYQRAVLSAWCHTLSERNQATESARVVAETARAHWRSDHTRLAAVESLIERRDTEHQAELAHREARELDDVAAQLWQFRQTGETR